MHIVIASIGLKICFGPFPNKRKANSFATKNFKDKGYKYRVEPVVNPEKIPKHLSW